MQNMDVLLLEAQAGNVDAMVELSRYYANEKDHGKAEEWADKAADAGSGTGYLLSLVCHNVGLTVAQHLHFWELLDNEAAIVIERAYKLKKGYSEGILLLTNDQLQTIDDAGKDALYAQGLARYGRDVDNQQCDEIAEMLEGVHSTKAYALRAWCLMHTEAYAEAFRLMVQIFHDEAYAAKEKEVAEEGIYIDTLCNMSLIYRKGLRNVVGQNLVEAVNVLQYALRYVRDEDFRVMIEKELGRYQKKMFGGYRYV